MLVLLRLKHGKQSPPVMILDIEPMR